MLGQAPVLRLVFCTILTNQPQLYFQVRYTHWFICMEQKRHKTNKQTNKQKELKDVSNSQDEEGPRKSLRMMEVSHCQP